MANIFQSVPANTPKRTKFDLSHEVKLTTDFGLLTPTFCTRVMPTDVMKCKTDVYLRLAPMLAPVMHMINLYVHSFYITEYALWKNFDKFITGGKDGTAVPVKPSFILTKNYIKNHIDFFTPGSLFDYLGFPAFDKSLVEQLPNDYQERLDAMPFLAYYKIWQWYFADENLTDFELEDDYRFDDGLISLEDGSWDFIFELRNRCWEKDYFTSCLPWPQRGEDVNMPLRGSGSVEFGFSRGNQQIILQDETSSILNPEGELTSRVVGGDNFTSRLTIGDAPANIDVSKTLTGNVDFTQGTGITVNEFRRFIAIQKFLERRAVVGWRYPEQLRGLWGAKPTDSRMFIPKYLGGGRIPVQVGEVLQTSETTTNSPLGDPAGRAAAAGNGFGFRRRFEEEGFVFSILSVIPRSNYMQGWPRLFRKWTKEDYAWPDFANLGEQEVLNEELCYNPYVPESNEKTFGYQSRYAEYKYLPSTIHGDFRTNMDYWHLGRKFTEVPALNADFLRVTPQDASRIFAVETSNGSRVDHLWCQIYNSLHVIRPLPRYGTPRI